MAILFKKKLATFFGVVLIYNIKSRAYMWFSYSRWNKYLFGMILYILWCCASCYLSTPQGVAFAVTWTVNTPPILQFGLVHSGCQVSCCLITSIMQIQEQKLFCSAKLEIQNKKLTCYYQHLINNSTYRLTIAHLNCGLTQPVRGSQQMHSYRQEYFAGRWIMRCTAVQSIIGL